MQLSLVRRSDSFVGGMRVVHDRLTFNACPPKTQLLLLPCVYCGRTESIRRNRKKNCYAMPEKSSFLCGQKVPSLSIDNLLPVP
jgi:hypothetical protein